ncbi:DUF5994 family protein [Streptomyces sp. NPDC056402]|uniref:DUF5994 family protein n=1 Tax=Streptomyces sp. NPDC056402 TaxID=3345810 RepID=UPI0035DDAC3D
MPRPETTWSREGLLGGARWPRTRDIAPELPACAAQRPDRAPRPDPRAGVDASAWNGLPARPVIDGRVVHLGSDQGGRRHRPHRAGGSDPHRHHTRTRGRRRRCGS